MKLSILLFLLVQETYLGISPVEGGETQAASILFAGDSDIELWKNTDQLYPDSVNKGDGGTTCKQWKSRIDKKLHKYQPAVVVLVCGENDLAWGYSPSKAFKNFKKVVNKISASGATTIYLGTKPEPSTKGLHAKYREYDALIRDYYEEKSQKAFVMIDVYPAFVELGNPKSLYKKDRLHLSNEGYGYWNDWLQAALDDSSGCRRWKNGECVLASSVDDDDCSDDPKFRFKGEEKHNCDWVGKKPNKRCDKRAEGKELWEYCPQSCGDC